MKIKYLIFVLFIIIIGTSKINSTTDNNSIQDDLNEDFIDLSTSSSNIGSSVINKKNEIFYFIDLNNGLDLNDGSKNKPFKNLEYAIEKIKNNGNSKMSSYSLIVSKGTFNLKSSIIIDNYPISIYGGYNGLPDWSRELVGELPFKSDTILKCKKQLTLNITGNNQNIVLSHLTIISSDATPIDANSGNKKILEETPSSFGVLISLSENVTLKFIHIESGDGADGYTPVGYNDIDTSRFIGIDGKDGNQGCESNGASNSQCGDCKSPKVGAGGLAGKCENSHRNQLSHGGKGGKPNRGRYFGENGHNATYGGGMGGITNDLIGLNLLTFGEIGLNGTKGSDAQPPKIQLLPSGIYTLSLYHALDGSNGKGGGGGGGGSGTFNEDQTCTVYGGSGSGGGGGGCGGRAGKNGGSGGSSIGLYIYKSNFTTIQFCNIISSDAGDGGKSSSPELGYAGGIGGKSSKLNEDSVSLGGYGGNGGNGGNGGIASGGPGGISISILTVFSSLNQICNQYNFGIKGHGGLSDNSTLNGRNGIVGNCYPFSLNCTTPSLNDCIQQLQIMSSKQTTCEFGEIRDKCGVCDGNGKLCLTNIGCDGRLNSSIKFDSCGVCGGDNSTCSIGCDGIVNSTKTFDLCGVCGGTNTTCTIGCDGIVDSEVMLDTCGVCGGDNTTCEIGCDGIKDSPLTLDNCGICGGDNTTCLIGCDGVLYSYKTYDQCNICGGDGTSCISKKELRRMKTSTKIFVSLVVIGGSIYFAVLAIYFIRRKLHSENNGNGSGGSGGSGNNVGSQYYRTKLVLEYQDSPYIQTELIKPNYETVYTANNSQTSSSSSIFSNLGRNNNSSHEYRQFKDNNFQIQQDNINNTSVSYPIIYNDDNNNNYNNNNNGYYGNNNNNEDFISHINR